MPKNKYDIDLVFDNMLEGLVVQDFNGQVIDHNRAALDILQLSKNQLIGRDSMDPKWASIHPDGTPFPGEEHPAIVALKTKSPVKNEIMGVRTPSGETKWIKVNSTPQKSDKDWIVISTFSDISIEFQQKIDLKDAHTYLDLALQGAGLGIWDWYLADNQVKFDKRWAEMLGLDHKKIAMQLSTWESRVHPDDLADCYKDIKNYMDGKTPFYENVHRMKHADGHWVYILDRGRFSEWDSEGNPTRFTGTHLDISENMQLKRKSEFILKNLKVGTWDWDIANNKLEWDDSNYQVFGIAREDFSGAYEAWESCLHPEFKEAAVSDLNLALNGSKSFNTIFAINKKNGDLAYIGGKGEVQRENGKPIRMVGINWDATKEYLTQKELERQKAMAIQHSKLASIGELAAGLGHEINNPLAIACGYLRLLQKEDQINRNFDLLEKIGKIDEALTRIQKIVDGVRSLSQPNIMIHENTDIIEIVLNTISFVEEIYKNQGISIRFRDETDPRYKTIKGDPVKVQQIFMNLLSNARDAMEKTTYKTILIEAKSTDQSIVLSIKDSGCGISTEIQDNVFDPFFTTKEVNKGTGLGLSIVYHYLKDIGGSIHLESEKCKGATFTLEFPIVREVV